jgi:alpha-1,3-rhamnosyltransferase
MTGNNKPLVSVIIPAYNHESYVKEAVLSVVNQTYGYENIQLIVADDCSKDNTPAILTELQCEYGFKLIIHKQNQGISATLNEMISFSEGEFIVGFASDDVLILNRIEIQVDILKRNPDIDILLGDGILINENSTQISEYKIDTAEAFTSYSFDELFLLQYPGFVSGTFIIRRELYQRIGTYDSNFKIEDYYFWLKAAYNNAKIVKCNRPLLYYRVHQNSVSFDGTLMETEAYKILDIYRSHPKYAKALQNRDIFNMKKWIFFSKISVVKHIVKHPLLLLNKKIYKILIMLILPQFILKRKFPENYYRYVSR